MTPRSIATSLLLVGALVVGSVLTSCAGRAGPLRDLRANRQSAEAAETATSIPGQTTVEVDGRSLDLYSPPRLQGVPGPTVLVLHGGLSNSSAFRAKLNLLDEAASLGFNVAYLNGTAQGPERRNFRVWNAGACCGDAMEQGIDDVGFVSDVITDLVRRGVADPSQVWLVGHSNGAMMSYRFLCERGTAQVRGIVAMSGALEIPSCPNAAGARILHVHGSLDTVVPVGGGGESRAAGSDFPPLSQTLGVVRASGASVDLVMLASAEHPVDTLEAAAQRELGESLPQLVGGFISGP